MSVVHQLEVEADTGEEILLTCPEPSCGRRVVLHRSRGLTVLDRGDFYALHSGSTGGMSMTSAELAS